MSGGSHNYLCWKDSREILNYQSEIQQMHDFLAQDGYDIEARYTLEILHLARLYESKMSFMLEKIGEVWRGVEWICSGDGADLKKLSEKFREIKELNAPEA